MSEETQQVPAVGAALTGAGGRRIGSVDAVFVDYLLVRTSGLVPVDLYVPTDAVRVERGGTVSVDLDADQAHARWHRPLKSVGHD